MARNRRLITDRDLQEAMEKEIPIRVFRDDAIVDSGGIVTRFDDNLVVIQSGVGDVAYHRRDVSEFYEMPSR
jgi:hypothetical protein